MKRRERPALPEEMPAYLATFTPSDWPKPPQWWWVSSDEQYARMKWNRARQQWRRARARAGVR